MGSGVGSLWDFPGGKNKDRPSRNRSSWQSDTGNQFFDAIISVPKCWSYCCSFPFARFAFLCALFSKNRLDFLGKLRAPNDACVRHLGTLFWSVFLCYCKTKMKSSTVLLNPFPRLCTIADFPGMCFASTKCATFEPGQYWDLTPFCGRSTCVLSDDAQPR